MLSEATDEGLENEFKDLIDPVLDPINDPPGVEGGVTKLNCS